MHHTHTLTLFSALPDSLSSPLHEEYYLEGGLPWWPLPRANSRLSGEVCLATHSLHRHLVSFCLCSNCKHSVQPRCRAKRQRILTLLQAWVFQTFITPPPRKPTKSEKTYRSLDKDGKVTDPQPLPCWFDASLRKYVEARNAGKEIVIEKEMEPAEVFMTVVVPAYNEEKRLIGMLEETVTFLERTFGSKSQMQHVDSAGAARQRKGALKQDTKQQGWEILLIDDGSEDRTVEVAQNFTRTHLLPLHPRRNSGPWTPGEHTPAVNIQPDSIRMVSLRPNRGKGGAVTHGMRHARGQYVIFADADGASDIQDLSKLLSACQAIEDAEGRGVAVGSRAHLVGSEAVVKRSKLRNFLMHSFHLILKFMTPPKTARIKDTQCGFKLFSRATLPYIVPHMHTEGWIFDVEMLMLAEFANIPVVEVPIGWKEVVGSKLNVLVDSIGMALGLAALRFCWGVGIYRQ